MRKTFFSLIVVCASIGATLALIELVSFFLLKSVLHAPARPIKEVVENPYHAFLGWVHAPNTAIITTDAAHTIQTDAEGNSITPFFAGEAPTVKIVVLGGSTVFGVGSSNNAATVPSQLEELLNKRLNPSGITVEVTNLGVRSYQSFQEFLHLHRHLTNHRADIVISLSGHNDAFLAGIQQDKESAFLPSAAYDKANIIRILESGNLKVFNLEKFVEQYSYTFHLVSELKKRKQESIVAKTNKELPHINFSNIAERASVSATHYKLMQSVSQMQGASFFFFLQPTVFTKGATQEEIPLIHKLYVDYDAYELKYYAELHRLFKTNTSFADLSHVFQLSKGKTLFIDHCHYNDEGAFLLASAIADKVAPTIVEKYKTRDFKAE